MAWEKPNSLIMKWRKWALQISHLIDEFWNSSQAHRRSVDYKPLIIIITITALLENLFPALLWYAYSSRVHIYITAARAPRERFMQLNLYLTSEINTDELL